MDGPDTKSDGELLTAFAGAGDQSAFATLVQRHGAMVHGVCLRVLGDHHEAQDVAQAVFLTLAHKAASLRVDTSIGGWLHVVAGRLAIDVRRSRVSRERREEAAMQELGQSDSVAFDTGLFRTELDVAIGQLPDRYRQPLVLFHLEDLSLDQTGSTLGLNANTLRTRLVRARELLRKKLVRRGVTVGSVGALTTLLSAEAGAAVLPATFVSATAKAAGLAAAGQLAAGVGTGAVSVHVAALTKGACNMLFWSSVKTAAIAVAVTGAVVGTGTVVAQKAMDSSAAPAVQSSGGTQKLPDLIRLRRKGNLLAGEWVCPTNPSDMGRFETDNPRLQCVAQGAPGTFEILGTNASERAGSGIWHFKMRANAANSNFWVMVMYGTKARIACIEYIQHTNELRLIRTVWKADGSGQDPDKRLDVRTAPNFEELKAKTGDDLRKYLAPVLAIITPGDLIGQLDDLPDYDMKPFRDAAKLSREEQDSLQRADAAFALGRYVEAIALLDGLVVNHPKSPAIPYALVLKGRCQEKTGNMNAAANEYRGVLDYFPNNTDFAPLSLFYLARIAAKEKDFRQSLRDLAKLEMDKLYNTHDVVPTTRRLKAVVEKLE